MHYYCIGLFYRYYGIIFGIIRKLTRNIHFKNIILDLEEVTVLMTGNNYDNSKDQSKENPQSYNINLPNTIIPIPTNIPQFKINAPAITVPVQDNQIEPIVPTGQAANPKQAFQLQPIQHQNNNILEQSIFNQYTFDFDWVDKYVNEEIKNEAQDDKNVTYFAPYKLNRYLKFSTIRHPNPANIIDFFIVTVPGNSEEYLHKYILALQKLFEWTDPQKDSNKPMLYPNIIGNFMRKGAGHRHQVPKLKPIIRALKIVCNSVYKNKRLLSKPLITDHLINFIKIEQRKPIQNRSNINLENFIRYLQDCLIDNPQDYINNDTRDIMPNPDIIAQIQSEMSQNKLGKIGSNSKSGIGFRLPPPPNMIIPEIGQFQPIQNQIRNATNNILEQSVFNQYNFNLTWIREYIEEAFPNGKDPKKQGINYKILEELIVCFDKHTISHPNPADIINLVLIKKSQCSESRIRYCIIGLQKLFEWTAHQNNDNDPIRYPNIIGNFFKVVPGRKREVPEIKPIINELINIYNSKYREKNFSINQLTTDHLINFMRIEEQKPQDKNAIINLENFMKYLQNCLIYNPQKYINDDTRDIMPNIGIPAQITPVQPINLTIQPPRLSPSVLKEIQERLKQLKPKPVPKLNLMVPGNNGPLSMSQLPQFYAPVNSFSHSNDIGPYIPLLTNNQGYEMNNNIIPQKVGNDSSQESTESSPIMEYDGFDLDYEFADLDYGYPIYQQSSSSDSDES